MRKAVVGLMLAVFLAVGCNSNSGAGTPTGPGATTAITVTLRDVVLVGSTAPATATATLAGGQTQSVTTGWRSDTTAVAAVTDAGTVTGVSNGLANIYVILGDRQGIKIVRVAPSYDGGWSGVQRVTACTASGELVGICEDEDFDVVGFLYPVALAARHPGDLTVTGEFTVDDVQFPTFTVQIDADGSIRMSSTTTVEGVRGDVAWHVNSTSAGSAAGTIRETYTLPGIAVGDVIIDSTVSVARTGAPAAAASNVTGRKARSIMNRMNAVRSR